MKSGARSSDFEVRLRRDAARRRVAFRGLGPPSSQLRAASLPVLLVLSLACSGAAVDAPAPRPVVTETLDSLPTLPPSLVDAPVAYDLGPAVAALESAVPRRFGDMKARRRSGTNRRVQTAFAAERDPFSVRLDGNTVRVGTVIHYQGRGWYDAGFGADVSGSCGEGAARPRARVDLATTLRITSDWRLRARSQLVRVEPFSAERRDQCKVTVFKVDVTDRVVNAARGAIEQKLAVLDAKLATTDVRTPVERWWRLLQRPIRLADSVWLVLQPTAVHLGPIAGSLRNVEIDVGLAGQPRVITGPRPPDGNEPLPVLDRAAAPHDHALHVLLEGELGYDVATAMLKKNIANKRIRRGTRWITIRDARLSGLGGRKVSLALRFDGSASGLVYLVGTPRYDPVTNQLYVPDLEYDVRSADLLVRGLEWMRRGDVRNFLRERARFPVTDLVERARARLERGMNRRLGQNATLEAKVTAGKVMAVRATQRGLLVRAQADGSARLVVTKVPALSRK